MSYLKFSVDEFLEKQELQRFKKFLDDDGFRYFLLAQSVRFGLIKKQFSLSNEEYVIENPGGDILIPQTISVNNQFTNGLCQEIGGLILQYNDIAAIDKYGNLIYAPLGTLTIPNDNLWYWIKIKHQFTNNEVGTFSIDTQGNVVGVGSKLTEVLRGQPNFPSKIKFPNSINNTLEYDVLEVIDDENIIIQGTAFQAESNLQLVVVGTFTPNAVPPAIDKDIFNYDSCIISVNQEVQLDTPTSFIQDEEFFLCRVKNTGAQLIVQDKRLDIWKTKSDHTISFIDKTRIDFLGIEKIKYSHDFTPKDKNQVYITWSVRTTNYAIDSNLNKFTIVDGRGGKGKTINDFASGYFDGWRLYTKDGSYSKILSSVKSGSQMNLILDVLDVQRFSNDGGVTINQDEVIITPDAEEIELIFTALNDDASQSVIVDNEGSLADKRFVFPINESLPYCELVVFDTPLCQYQVRYRLKTNDVYTPIYNTLSDTQFGYYTELAFDQFAEYLDVVNNNNYSENVTGGYIKTYTDGIITLLLHPNAYSNFVTEVLTGDLLGVQRRAIVDAITEYYVEVGVNRQYQLFQDAVPYTLNGHKFIILKPGKRNGNFFKIHITQKILKDVTNLFNLRIVQNFVDVTNFSTLKVFTNGDFAFLQNEAVSGMTFRCTWDGSTWVIDHVNETSQHDAWINYPLVSDELMVDANHTMYTNQAGGAAYPYFNNLFYKIVGKTCHISVTIRKANIAPFVGTSFHVPHFYIKLPTNIIPRELGVQPGSGKYRNEANLEYTNFSVGGTDVDTSASNNRHVHATGGTVYLGTSGLLGYVKRADSSNVFTETGGNLNSIAIGDPIIHLVPLTSARLLGSNTNSIHVDFAATFEIQ